MYCALTLFVPYPNLLDSPVEYPVFGCRISTHPSKNIHIYVMYTFHFALVIPCLSFASLSMSFIHISRFPSLRLTYMQKWFDSSS